MSDTIQLNQSAREHLPVGVSSPIADIERLPFTVRLVRTEDQLLKVCELRSLAYGRHLPDVRESFAQPDEIDWQPGTVIFLAEDKATGLAIGSARLQINAACVLEVEQNVALPPHIQSQLLTEITRLSVRPGFNQFSVRNALWKACHRYCLATQVHGILLGARRSLVRQYLMLGFKDVFDDARDVYYEHLGNVKHRILIFNVQSAEREWYQSNHPLYDFMVRKYHPDIDVFAAVSSGWARPRRADIERGGVRYAAPDGAWEARSPKYAAPARVPEVSTATS